MNYKEGTGVRARVDLSANAKPERGDEAISSEHLVMCTQWLLAELELSERHGRKAVMVPNTFCRRLADVILHVAGALPEAAPPEDRPCGP